MSNKWKIEVVEHETDAVVKTLHAESECRADRPKSAKEIMRELVRCLGYECCARCGLPYRRPLNDCVLADHIEAYDAIQNAKEYLG